MKKIIIWFAISLILLFTFVFIKADPVYSNKTSYFVKYKLEYYLKIKNITVPAEYEKADRNRNGIFDPLDITNGARLEVRRKTKYKDAYYIGGFPPDSEGVCTDVIWRAFENLNIDLKKLIDNDIKNNAGSYSRTNGKPDPNIDFRRVPNLNVFFKRNAKSLTTKIIPGDIENLKQWQPGDIIIILKPYQHIGIISDKRGPDGVPYLIHNTYPHAVETPNIDMSKGEIAAHYRWKY